ncbi:hypothetical protein JCM9279_000072, partial [Rhodotorula babjevae]
MPSADPTPSLLSRLSPAPPYPAVSRSSPGRELPPHLQHALDNDVRLGRSPPTSSSFPASPPKPSGLSSSPPKPSTSPRKGNPNALRSPQPGSHLSSLPDDVLSRSAQPIPAARSTRSSRWAASPPTSPALGGTSSSPQAVFGSPASLRSAAAATMGASPIAIKLGSSPGARSGLSPPKASASGALNQIESMLAQLRATPTSSPPKASTSVPKPSSSLPRHSPLVGASPLPPSVPAAAPPLPAAAPAPAPAAPSPSPKKKVLGGRSKWARADDEEPDEFASVEEKEQRQQGAPAGEEARVKDEPAPPAPPLPALAPAAATAAAHEPLPTPAPAPSSPPAAAPAPAPPPLEHRPSFAPSVATIRTETANAHLSWADDDDDELPDLDDWGIPASSLPPPSFDDLDEPAPRQPPWSAAGPPPQHPQQSHPTLPPLGARRRSHSNASGGGGGKHGHGHGHGHGSGRQARSPPNQHAQPPHHALRSPPTSPRVAAATSQPLKAPSRLFASAARAATAGAGAGAGAGARELPPHVIPHPAQAPSPAAAPPSTKPRERMAPSSALFSRLSGIGPSGAAGSGSG